MSAIRALGLMCALTCLALPATASADSARTQLFAGLSSGGIERVRFAYNDCTNCKTEVIPQPMADVSFYTFAFGFTGSEGLLRGGGEVVSMIGSGNDHTGGYAGVVTYAGFESGRVLAQAGFGLGLPWITDGDSLGVNVDGNIHVRLGARLREDLVLLTRGDLLRWSRLGQVVTVGLQWTP
jgi:hypothetical protein